MQPKDIIKREQQLRIKSVMEPKAQEKPMDFNELRREVVEMRHEIAEKYKTFLAKDFEIFKIRLTNIATQPNIIPYSESDNPVIDMSILESNTSQQYDVEGLTRYINNAESFINRLQKKY